MRRIVLKHSRDLKSFFVELKGLKVNKHFFFNKNDT